MINKQDFKSVSDVPNPLVQTSQRNTKLSPVAQMSYWIFVLVPKDSNAKKESISCTEP
jgi:hypothetical protein